MNPEADAYFRHVIAHYPADQQPVCVNDYGDAVYSCHYTDAKVYGAGAKWTGAFNGSASRYVMAATSEADARLKESRRLYDESEGNCNTCRRLCRMPKAITDFEKSQPISNRTLAGTCDKKNGVFEFYPADPMHMPCYEERG